MYIPIFSTIDKTLQIKNPPYISLYARQTLRRGKQRGHEKVVRTRGNKSETAKERVSERERERKRHLLQLCNCIPWVSRVNP